MRQMRECVRAHRCRPEQCVDIVCRVMSNVQLHLRAADGYARKVGCNFATFSNKARLLEEGPPYCEFIFISICEVLE